MWRGQSGENDEPKQTLTGCLGVRAAGVLAVTAQSPWGRSQQGRAWGPAQVLPRGWSSGQCPRFRWNCSQSLSLIRSCSPSRWMSCCRCCCCHCRCPCWEAPRLCSWPAGLQRCQPTGPPGKEREGKPSEQTRTPPSTLPLQPSRQEAQATHLSTITWHLKRNHQGQKHVNG